MKMPYGKFKGQDIEKLPSGYLKWVAENFDESRAQGKAICLEADKEYQFREKTGTHFYEDAP